MSLPGSGPIALSQIAAEFGLAADTPFPSGFYGKGGAPANGALSLANFYGRSTAPAASFTPDGGDVSDAGPGVAAATLQCSIAATWSYTGGGAYGSVNQASGTNGTDIVFAVEARPIGSTGNSADVTRSWNVTGTAGGLSRSFTVTLTAFGENGGGGGPQQ